MTAGVNTANHNQLEPNVEGGTLLHVRDPRAPVGETLQGYAGLDDPNRLFILPTSELGHTTPTSLFPLLSSPQPSGAGPITPWESCL